jgi:hypothetical protein
MAFEPDFINASELSEFVYCKRAWHLTRRGAPSALVAARKRGVEFHQRHSEATHAPPTRAASVVGWLAVGAILLFVLWLVWVLR